ncbi:MAG: TIGR01777 family oxidoreductase [Cytophagales bacterium]|nr:TIGR01777 family oxidoreductase [Cytophagales bacterium]
MNNRVLITGGTGFIGGSLIQKFLADSISVHVLSRHIPISKYGEKYFHWDVKSGYADRAAFENVDAVIHLAGANVASKRWSSTAKSEILESRTNSTKLLYDTFKTLGYMPNCYITASGVGIYESNNKKACEEDAPQGHSFLATVSQAWEQAARPFEEAGVRCCYLRTGMVLGNNGGALERMVMPVKYGISPILGIGHQYISWIHINDLHNIYIRCAKNATLAGVYNAVAPNPVTHYEFMLSLTRKVNKYALKVYIPTAIVKILLGEMSDIVLESNNISCKKILETGFEFRHRTLESALEEIYINQK